MHPVGGERVGLAPRDTVDKDERVDDGEERVVGSDKAAGGYGELGVALCVGPPDLPIQASQLSTTGQTYVRKPTRQDE